MEPTAKGSFSINLASIDIARNLVAEIYFNSFSIATIHTENKDFEIQFFSDVRINSDIKSISVDLNEFIKTIQRAKMLLSNPPDFLYDT